MKICKKNAIKKWHAVHAPSKENQCEPSWPCLQEATDCCGHQDLRLHDLRAKWRVGKNLTIVVIIITTSIIIITNRRHGRKCHSLDVLICHSAMHSKVSKRTSTLQRKLKNCVKDSAALHLYHSQRAFSALRQLYSKWNSWQKRGKEDVGCWCKDAAAHVTQHRI